MEPGRTKPLVEGALLAALVVLLGLLSFYTGFGWLLPIPGLLAYVRNGRRNAVLVTVVGSCLLGLWIGPVGAVGSLFFIAALGLVPGWMLERRAGAGATIVAMALALLISAVLGAAATTAVWHANQWAQTWAAMVSFLRAHAAEVRRYTAMSPSQVEGLLLRLVPTVAGGAALLQAAGVYLLSAVALGRLGHALPALPPFAHWRAPRAVAFLYLLALVADLLVGGRQVMGAVFLNVALALGFVFAITGCAVGYGWLRGRGVARDWAALGVVGGAGLLGLLGLGVAPAAVGVYASLRGPGGAGPDPGPITPTKGREGP